MGRPVCFFSCNVWKVTGAGAGADASVLRNCVMLMLSPVRLLPTEDATRTQLPTIRLPRSEDKSRTGKMGSRAHQLPRFLRLDGFQILAERGTEVFPLESKFDRSLEPAELVSGIVANAFQAVAIDLIGLEQPLDAIGELQFSAGAQRRLLKQIEDFWRENVTADDRIFGGCFSLLRLLHHALHIEQPRLAGHC